MTRKKKPLIGVTTSSSTGWTIWWFTKLAIRIAGGKAVRLTAEKQDDISAYDGYVISGGVDIDPSHYNQQNIASVGVEPERDLLEINLIKHALKNHKPLMGICRGAQMINIVRGGALHQNARDFYDGFVPTDSVLGKIFSRRKVLIIKEGILCNLFRKNPELYVNSIHHQAIDKLGQGIEVVAKDELGIVQAIESINMQKQFILGMQWHPEFMLHTRSNRKIFSAMLDACRD